MGIYVLGGESYVSQMFIYVEHETEPISWHSMWNMSSWSAIYGYEM